MNESEVSSSSLMSVYKTDTRRVNKKTLQMILEQCQRALESIGESDNLIEPNCDVDDASERRDGEDVTSGSNREAEELCDRLKSKVECPDFIDKLGNAKSSLPEHICDEGGSWHIVSKNDLWEDENDDDVQDDFVLVSDDDIVEGIAGFMAAYLLSLKQTKELTPNQLQEALSKTFSVKKKGKLQKAWDGSKVIYNVASWGATAVGIYQNPALIRAASDAFWASCHVISKVL